MLVRVICVLILYIYILATKGQDKNIVLRTVEIVGTYSFHGCHLPVEVVVTCDNTLNMPNQIVRLVNTEVSPKV